MTLNGAATRSVISSVVSPTEQGRLQGALTSLASMVGIFAPGLFAFLLSEGIRTGGKPLSGFPFWACGALSLIGTLIAIWVTRSQAAAQPVAAQSAAPAMPAADPVNPARPESS